jgi:hypothetical protein
MVEINQDSTLTQGENLQLLYEKNFQNFLQMTPLAFSILDHRIYQSKDYHIVDDSPNVLNIFQTQVDGTR